MTREQLDFFRSEEIQKIKETTDNVRRGIYHRLGMHQKEIEVVINAQNNQIMEIKYLIEEIKKLLNEKESA